MIDTPDLFLATGCASFAEYRRLDVPDADQLAFEPGFSALAFLCQLLTGRPVHDSASLGRADNSLIYIDGPPNPVTDEGFQLHRLSAEVVARLVGLSPDERDATAVVWQAELDHFRQGRQDRPSLTAALTGLADFARRGDREGKSVFVAVLFH